MKIIISTIIMLILLLSCSETLNLNRVKGIRGSFAPVVTGEGVIFSILAPGASFVTIAGNFNGWNSQTTPMTKKIGGVWTITLPLEKKRKYNYMFVIDGYWVADPDNPVTENNGNGSVNSVIVLK